MQTLDFKKYFLVFLITAAIFATALYVSDYFNNRRIAEVRAISDQIAIDILSSETQFNLLAESSCKDLGQTVLSGEINSLAEKLSYTESRLGADNEEVIGLKRYYSLLQIKDYLLVKRISEKCGTKPISILYFYSNAGDCEDCEKMGYVLTYLREQYPELRVYSFDYNLDLSALQTLVSLFEVAGALPATVIDGEVHYGFRSIEEFETLIPELAKLKAEKEEALERNNATTSEEEQ